jgi:magnesium transporter
MIRALYFPPNKKLILDLSQDKWADVLLEKDGLLWVDFQDTSPSSDEPLFREIFKFHPLAIDDALQETHVPKLDDWGSYLYIVFQVMGFQDGEISQLPGTRDLKLNFKELDVFLGVNYIITHHDEQIDVLDHVWQTIQRDERYLSSGTDHVLYRLVDEVIANMMPLVEALDDEIDQVEEEIFNSPGNEILARVFSLKKTVLSLRRMIYQEREVLNKLARDDYIVIDAHDKVYFRDVYDHLVRLMDILEGLRDLISGVLDTYLSTINNRMNDIMKTLTIITTLFMPLTFITGFFGMNFFAAPKPYTVWTEPYVFYPILLLFIVTPILMFLWMKRKKWM